MSTPPVGVVHVSHWLLIGMYCFSVNIFYSSTYFFTRSTSMRSSFFSPVGEVKHKKQTHGIVNWHARAQTNCSPLKRLRCFNHDMKTTALAQFRISRPSLNSSLFLERIRGGLVSRNKSISPFVHALYFSVEDSAPRIMASIKLG